MDWLIHDPVTRLLGQLVAIILVARVLGRLLAKVGQPLVIAEIAAGILLGPSLLGWVFPETKHTLFAPESLGALKLISELGLVLFMFLVGLELDTRVLRGKTHSAVAISHSSIIVPFALGVGLAVWLHPRFAADVPFWGFATFMGAAMSITAFPVLARILAERRLDRTRVGAITIACAAVDDATAWCILAFVVAMARAEGIAGAAWTTVFALAYIGVMVWVVRPLMVRVAARFTRPEAVGQDVIAAVLIGAFVSAWTTELIGIHALFGAFLFGAMLPKDGALARSLAAKLEDLVLIVLLPLFFAYSGLRTDLGRLLTMENGLVTLLVVATACAGKFGGALLPARLTGMSWRESSALAILMNTRGLMELIVLNIGLDLGVISPTVFSMMVVMALVTTVITSPLLDRIYPTRYAAPHGARAAPEAGSILVCVADARTGASLVVVAGALAGDPPRPIEALHLTRSGERGSDRMASDREPIDAFAPLVQRAAELSLPVSTRAFASTDPAADIARVAKADDAALVLLGLHRPLLAVTRLGGVVRDVLRSARPRVGVLVDRGLVKIERVLVPYHGTEHDRAALDLARPLADRGVRVVLLHVVPPGRHSAAPATQAAVTQVFGDDEKGVRLEVVESATPAEAVIARAKSDGFDLVIVGAGPNFGLEERRYGFQPEPLIAAAPTSMLIVRERRTRDAADQSSSPPR